MNQDTIGFIGPGIMGLPMATNLIHAGYRLQVYARRRNAADPLVAKGARYCESPALAADNAQAIVTIVSDTPDVEAVILGENGVIQGAAPGAVVIDMSTISPSTTRTIAKKLRARGIEMLDAPVSGGEQGAIDGTLSIMVGGKQETFERLLPVLKAMGKQITHIGENGAGQVAKACNQILVAQIIAAVAEALQLARASGADPGKVRQALLGGFAYSRILDVHGKRMLEHDFEPGFKTRLHNKDMRIALKTATESGVSLPGAELAAGHIEKLVASGGGELDSAAIATVIEKISKSET
jgi:2-hydroxy-3-oxopropionate reductase